MNRVRAASSAPVPQKHKAAPALRLRLAVPVAMGLVLWVALLLFPQHHYGVALDDSWEQGLGQFLKWRAQAGVDYIFTYGPLGYFYTVAFDADLYWLKYAWEAALKLLMAVTFVFILSRSSLWVIKLLFVLLVVALLGPANRSLRDTLFPLFMLSAALVIVTDCQRAALVGGLGALLGVLSLVKVSFLFLSLVYLGIVGAFLVGRKHYRAGGLLLATYALTFLGLWVTLGQAVGNLPAFWHAAVEIARGFDEAMSKPGNPWQVVDALGALVFLVLAVATFDWRPQRLGATAPAALLAVTLFLQWKQGFTRHDNSHAAGFFAFTTLLPLLLASLLANPPHWRLLNRFALAATVGLSLAGLYLSAPKQTTLPQVIQTNIQGWGQSLGTLVNPWEYREFLAEHIAPESRDWYLPRIRREVGDAAVDLLSYVQGILFLNHLNWRPRPVFQSYSAYTPELLQRNGDYFRSPTAPEYVALALTPLDNRLLTSEDSQALLEIFRRYEPVIVEKGVILLKRLPNRDIRDERPKVVAEQTIHLNAPVSLPARGDRYQYLQLKIRYSTWGRIKAFFYQPGPLFLSVPRPDGPPLLVRLVPSLMEEAVLIDPLLVMNLDVLSLYTKDKGTPISSFTIVADESARADYEEAIPLTVLASPPLAAHPFSHEKLHQLLAEP